LVEFLKLAKPTRIITRDESGVSQMGSLDSKRRQRVTFTLRVIRLLEEVCSA